MGPVEAPLAAKIAMYPALIWASHREAGTGWFQAETLAAIVGATTGDSSGRNS
jgi:hypothetical protein